jgi:hypothetical protein
VKGGASSQENVLFITNMSGTLRTLEDTGVKTRAKRRVQASLAHQSTGKCLEESSDAQDWTSDARDADSVRMEDLQPRRKRYETKAKQGS